MNLKFLSFALISGMAAAHMHDHPHEHPNCTIGTDTQDCTLPDGGAGMFLCHPHGNHSHQEGPGVGGGIGATLLRVVDRLAGHLPHHDALDHKRTTGGHVRGDTLEEKDPHRQLRTGSSSSSSSRSWISSSGMGMMGGSGRGHHGSKGMMMGRSGGMGSKSKGRGSKGHHHGGMMMGGGSGRHGHHGGRSGGMMGRCGPPGFLSQTRCAPVDGPPKDDFPFHAPHHGGPHHGGPPTCGCCGDVCPAKLDCACTCDLTDWEGTVMEKDAGIWVTVTLKDETTPVKKCVHAGAYADANRVQCVTECSADMVEDQNDAVELLEEHFGDDLDEFEEKESRD